MTTRERLRELAVEISQCRMCDRNAIGVVHAGLMRRGNGYDLMVIGMQPGRTEVEKEEAFSGPAGFQLMCWLREATVGDNREEIFSRTYLTSLCKCQILDDGDFDNAFRNCFPFLKQQIELIQPRLCATLGRKALRTLFRYRGSLDKVVGSRPNLNSLAPLCFRISLPIAKFCHCLTPHH